MEKIAVIGAGISGLAIAQMLKATNNVVVFEKEERPGGLIKCENVGGNLYHTVGGHVFNSKRQDVLEWFWKFFDRTNEFTKTIRKAVVNFDNNLWVDYPIENHVYMFPKNIVESVIGDLLAISKASKSVDNVSFEDFLLQNFGQTLYQLYFQPYNEKVWKRNLSEVPLSWLDGKLPMPNVKEILYNNFCHVEESAMVHSSFFYPKKNGSQFLADRLAEGLYIEYNQEIAKMERKGNLWIVNGMAFDKVVFSGNIKALPYLLDDKYITVEDNCFIERLEYHGTTSVFCEIDKNPYSWIYMPSRNHASHRIICTGNFSPYNNVSNDRITASIEFSDYVSEELVQESLKKIPLNPRYICRRYTQYTYPIQNADTRKQIKTIKQKLAKENLYLLGRFAEWEYYNMDAAIGAAMDLSKIINN